MQEVAQRRWLCASQSSASLLGYLPSGKGIKIRSPLTQNGKLVLLRGLLTTDNLVKEAHRRTAHGTGFGGVSLVSSLALVVTTPDRLRNWASGIIALHGRFDGSSNFVCINIPCNIRPRLNAIGDTQRESGPHSLEHSVGRCASKRSHWALNTEDNASGINLGLCTTAFASVSDGLEVTA